MTPLSLGICAIFIILSVMLAGVLSHQVRTRRQFETTLRDITDSIDAATFVLRTTGAGVSRYEFVSVGARNPLGIEREQILRDPDALSKLMLKDDRARLNASMADLAAESARLEFDARIYRPDGDLRWLHISAEPTRQTNGDVLWRGSWRDITDAKNTEHTLHQAVLRLEEAQSIARVGDWTCDLPSGAMTWSAQVYTLLQREPTPVAPNLQQAVALFENGAKLTADAFFKAQETGAPQRYEMTAQLPNGRIAVMQIITVPVVDESQSVIGMQGTIQDISARKILEQTLRQARETAEAASRAKDEFLSTMSHEIRTPLNGVLGMLELMTRMPLTAESRNAVAAVRESGRSIQRIIDDILDLAKVDAGKLVIREQPTRIRDVLAALQRVHGEIATSRGLLFRCRTDSRISQVVMVDGVRLRQILGNFINNAIKFTPTGGIEVRMRLVGRSGAQERLRFEVQDTGIGISAERQRKLFQPFEQADDKHAVTTGGSGLGLSICKRLAELLNGRVSLSSEVGKGTIIMLELPVTVTDLAPVETPTETLETDVPLIVAEPEITQPEIQETAPVATHRPLVLVVDDHLINRMLIVKQLNTLGYAAEDVESGAEAIEKWKTGRFDLVFTDCNMPEMSGYQLAQHIRAAESASGLARIPIVACSANVVGAVRQDCVDAGMDDYISKPTALNVIAEKLGRFLPVPNSPSSSNPDIKSQTELASSDAPVDRQASAASPEPDSVEPVISRRVIEHFQRVNQVDVKRLQQAFEQRDMPTMTHIAHRIKGACGFIGATGLASVCSMIEQAGRSNDESALEWLMETFRTELEQLNAKLDAA